ncbi:thioredoxin-like protein [Thiogranum longum]|uniref:Thioredoxin-like protein n=1 Tax=Thiogranum longum TaxID=1537524 RepID=A0A4R1HHA0_9GAMM|nr:HEAT repeat domain-containing protein [Thiogranum longum]TCK18759.1 thioredoxin-like protein [Thiogranum longum]
MPIVPDALLLLTSRCPYCPTVLQGLSELVKSGKIGRLEVVNIEIHPEVAEQHGARGVPWIRIGDFELEGLHSPAELAEWAQHASSQSGLSDGFAALLKDGQLGKVINTIRNNPRHLDALLHLAAAPETELTVRIGISAVLEDLQGSPVLQEKLPALLELSQHEDPRIRTDAAHYLMLTGLPQAAERLQAMTGDSDSSVREVASDELAELHELLDAAAP